MLYDKYSTITILFKGVLSVKKYLAFILTGAMMCTMLTGCAGGKTEVDIGANGVGSIKMSAGMTKDALVMMAQLESASESTTMSEAELEAYVNSSLADAEAFTINGKTYYGETEEKQFSSIKELNRYMRDTLAETSDMQANEAALSFATSDGKLYLAVLTLGYEEAESTYEDYLMNEASNSGVELNMSEEDMAKLLDDMCFVYEIDMPSDIKSIKSQEDVYSILGVTLEDEEYKIATDNSGIQINGDNITIDVLNLTYETDTINTWLFETECDKLDKVDFGETDEEYIEVEEVYDTPFDDVPVDFWAFESIYWAADRGITVGTGNNMFTPNGTLTRAQFYTMLARYMYIDSSVDSDFWAEGNIRACIDMGVVIGVTEQPEVINPADWNVPMLREEAVAVMCLVEGGYAETVNNIEIKDIPDYDKIDEVYKEYIHEAYQKGLTVGVDTNKTFAPKGELTRAQGCELIYRVYNLVYQ